MKDICDTREVRVVVEGAEIVESRTSNVECEDSVALKFQRLSGQRLRNDARRRNPRIRCPKNYYCYYEEDDECSTKHFFLLIFDLKSLFLKVFKVQRIFHFQKDFFLI